MASSTCHVVGGTKRVRVERTVRRDHPAEMTAPQDDGSGAWQPVRHATPQWRTITRLATGRRTGKLLDCNLSSHPLGVALMCQASLRGNPNTVEQRQPYRTVADHT